MIEKTLRFHGKIAAFIERCNRSAKAFCIQFGHFIRNSIEFVRRQNAFCKFSFQVDSTIESTPVIAAENLIRLSGLELDKDITIQEIGLRPGEKLYEELLMRSETLSKTSNEKIFIEQQQDISKDVIMDDLLRLDEAVTRDIPPQELITMLREMVPTYTSPEEINGRATAEVS